RATLAKLVSLPPELDRRDRAEAHEPIVVFPESPTVGSSRPSGKDSDEAQDADASLPSRVAASCARFLLGPGYVVPNRLNGLLQSAAGAPGDRRAGPCPTRTRSAS